MGPEFVARVIRTTVVVTLVAALFAATYLSPGSGLGFLAGALWGCLNLLVISRVVRVMVGAERPSKLRVVKLSLIKFPVIYCAGFLLLRAGVFSPQSLVAGFSIVLLVIVLKALGAAVAGRCGEKTSTAAAQGDGVGSTR